MPPRKSTDSVRGGRENLYDVEDWLAPSHAGRILGTSGQWVAILCRQGKLRAVRTALGWLVDPDDIERVREEREAKLKIKLKSMAKSRTIKEPSARGRVTKSQARAAARTVKENQGEE